MGLVRRPGIGRFGLAQFFAIKFARGFICLRIGQIGDGFGLSMGKPIGLRFLSFVVSGFALARLT